MFAFIIGAFYNALPFYRRPYESALLKAPFCRKVNLEQLGSGTK